MDIERIIEELEKAFEAQMKSEDFIEVKPSQLWDDHTRIYASKIYAAHDCIVVKGQTRTVDYYGGMSYVDADDRKAIGKYSIYLATSSRVCEHLARVFPGYYNGMDDEEED